MAALADRWPHDAPTVALVPAGAPGRVVLIAADLDPGLRHDLELLPACECLPCKGVSRTDEVRPGGT